MKAALPEAALVLRKAGVIVLRAHEDGWRVLLLRAYRNWGFPKGEIEPGEIPLAAAVREVAEETALTDLEFRWGEVCIETPPRAGHKRARYYIATSPAGRVFLPVSAELGRPEHHEFRWLTFATARELLTSALRFLIDWAQEIVMLPANGTFAGERRPIR
jgi:bis(5'-nucleosidyl)-tetraphosphatase